MAAVGAQLPAVADLRDRAADSSFAQVVAIGPGPVGLVGPHPIRSTAWPADAYAGHPDALQDLLELGTVVPPAGGDQEGQRLLSMLDRQVHLRGQSTA